MLAHTSCHDLEADYSPSRASDEVSIPKHQSKLQSICQGMPASMGSSNALDSDLSLSGHSASAASRQPYSTGRAFKQASDSFVKRDLLDSLNVLDAVLFKPGADESSGGTAQQQENEAMAPVASASRTVRVKCWCLYIRLLNELIEIGADDGKKIFGVRRWKELADSARLGLIWETVVNNGYFGQEAIVDAEVVANLTSLLLAHMPSQQYTQQRLEAYLAAVSPGALDIASHMQRPKSTFQTRSSGTSTPRDLQSRLQIIELFVLHVLPRNDEWQFARDYVTLNEVLDDERKETLLHALQALQDEKRLDEQRQEQLQKQRSQHLRETTQDQAHSSPESTIGPSDSAPLSFGAGPSDAAPPSSASPQRPQSGQSVEQKKNLAKSGEKRMSGPIKSNGSERNSKSSATRVPRGSLPTIFAIQQVIIGAGRSMWSNPAVLFRTLAFIVALLMAITRREIRSRLQRLLDLVWIKLKQTIGMGTKVSYV